MVIAGAYYGRATLKSYVVATMLWLLSDHFKQEQAKQISVAKEELGHLRVDYLYGGVQYTIYLTRDRRAGRGSSTQLRMVKPDGEEVHINHPQGYAFPHSPSQLGLSAINRINVLGEVTKTFVDNDRVV